MHHITIPQVPFGLFLLLLKNRNKSPTSREFSHTCNNIPWLSANTLNSCNCAVLLSMNCVRSTDIERRSQNSYTTPCNGVCQPWSSNWGVFGFLSTTHAETKANKMCPRSLHAVWYFTCLYLQALMNAVHTHLTNHSYFGKKTSTPFGTPC